MVASQAKGVQEVNGDAIDVVVEIPAGTRNKYEIDHRTGKLRLERQLPASLVYPADYGFVPDTLARDGDPLDALVLIDEPTIPGCVVRVSLLGVLWLKDENGDDPKLITLLPERAEREGLADIDDLPQRTLEEIEHFFSTYKDLESDGSSTTGGYGNRSEALKVLFESRKRQTKQRR